MFGARQATGGTTSTQSAFFPLPFNGCGAYTYPSLEMLDLSGNAIGDCAAAASASLTTWAADCPALEEAMLASMTAMADLTTLDLSGNTFTPRVAFPPNWRMAEYWPEIKHLKLGHIFDGPMSFTAMSGAVGSPVKCPAELQASHRLQPQSLWITPTAAVS